MSYLKQLLKKMEVKNRKKKSSIDLSKLGNKLERSEIIAKIMYCNIYQQNNLFDKSNIVINFLASYKTNTEVSEYDYFKNIIDKINGITSISYYSEEKQIKWLGVSFNPESLYKLIKYENMQSNIFISELIKIVKSIPSINQYIFGDEYEFIDGIGIQLTEVSKDNLISHYDNINLFDYELLSQYDQDISKYYKDMLYLSTVLLSNNSVKQTITFLNAIMHNEYSEAFTTSCIDQMTNDYSNFTVEGKHIIIDYQFFTKLVPTISEYAENEKETFNADIDEIVD